MCEPLVVRQTYHPVEYGSRDESCKYVYQVMSLYIHSRDTKQDIDGQEAKEHFPAASPCQIHQDGRYSDMRGGKCCRGAFACMMRIFDQGIEEPFVIAGSRKQFGMAAEIMSHVRKYSLSGLLPPYGREIELRSDHRKEDIYGIV